MNLRTLRLVLLIALAFTLFASALHADDQGRHFHWSGKLPADQIVEIKNVNGSIDADGNGGDQVEVTAEKSGPHADEVRIEVATSDKGVIICAIYPKGFFGGYSGPCSSSWHANNINGNDTKVHFIVHLPKNLRFGAQDINGDVNAKGLGRFVHGESVNGSVRISTSAWAEAETVNGSIEARMGSADWTGRLAFKSVNGSVTLELPDDLSADINFKSLNGGIRSDFPLTIGGGFVGHTAKGRIGNGGRELTIETVNGSVNVREAGGTI